MNAAHTPKLWYSVSYLNAQTNAYWIVCRDKFAGRDYLLTPTGRHKRFLSKEAATNAIAKATGSAA